LLAIKNPIGNGNFKKATDGETSANQSTFDKSTSDQTDQNYSQDFDINRIVALINRAQNARKEKLEPFEAQTKLRMERIHKERAFQQAVESQARGASLDRIREMVAELETHLANPDEAPLRLKSCQFSMEQKLEIANAVEALLSIEAENERAEAIAGVSQKVSDLKKQQDEVSSSRQEELDKLRAALDAENVNDSNAFQSLFRAQGSGKYSDFRFKETKATFYDTVYQNFYVDKQDQQKMILLEVSVRDESYNDRILNIDDKKRFEQFWTLVDGPRQLMLVSGRLEIRVKTNAELEQGELVEVFKEFVVEPNLKQLLEHYGA